MIGNFSKSPILEYLSKGPYYIPDYQRDYAWDEKNEIKELWEDISTVHREKIKEFFMGQIVLHHDIENEKQYIIDGQQRTITLTLLFLALRNSFMALSQKSNDNADKQVQKINASLGLIDKDDNEHKLFLGETDNLFFFDKILFGSHESIELLKPKRKAQKNLVRGYMYLYEKIAAYLGEEKPLDEKVEKLKDLYSTISKELCVLSIETTDESEAFMIFETLNARGRDLETSDLLKNYFFRISKTNLDTVKKNWQVIATEFENESITNYIRCIWNSQHSFEREKMLYRQITNEYKTPKACLELSKLMLDGKDMYLSMVDPENKHCFPSGSGKQVLESILLDLADLKIKTYYPLILAYYLQNKDNGAKDLVSDLIKIASAIETLIFRDIVICKNSPNTYEVTFAEIAKKITDMSVTSTDEIVDLLKQASVKDAEFEAGFSIYAEKDTPQGKSKIRYILRKIINSEAKEMVIKRNNSEVHIEHIMPVTKGEWKISNEDHDENLWKIGNLTLLDFEINEEIKNALFDKKSQEYRKSEIKMTKELGDTHSKWDIEEINIRQKELCEQAKNIWKF